MIIVKYSGVSFICGLPLCVSYCKTPDAYLKHSIIIYLFRFGFSIMWGEHMASKKKWKIYFRGKKYDLL